MKSKKHRNRSRNVPNPVARGYPHGYEPSFKKSVILYAEQKGNSEARKRYGISEETIKRWRKLRREIMELAQQCVRRSQRHAYTPPMASSSSQVVSEPLPLPKKEKEKSVEEKGETNSSKTDLDSMPLQQRLSQNHNEPPPSTPTQETVLQSQPISPTKLKVTRQGAKPQQPPAKPPTPPPPNPEVCLKWNSHHMNMQSAFPTLLLKEQYVDATLVSEGKTMKCHRMILSSCSSYFEEVLNGISPFQHPVLFMKDIPFWILKALCDFMYAGEVHIFQDKLQDLLNVAETLKIKGLAGDTAAKEDVKPMIPEIKQEVEATPPPKVPEKPLKEEKEEEPPPPAPPKPAKHETVKPSKKKEDKKSKHSSQTPKEKEKEKVVEEPPPKVTPKVAPKVLPKVVVPKVAPKVVPKVVLPKAQSLPKTTVKNVVKNVMQKVPKPSTSKATHASRKSDTSRKTDKHKADIGIQKEKEKEKEKPPLKKDNINDPLDLLQPVYEEIAKEDPPPIPKSVSPAKLKERGNVPVRRGVTKKVKKRRYAEYAEEREESPPPVFSSRKGTRSRPHVKIPKFFHTHYEETQKETTDATIVREPHTDQSDPLIGLEEVEEIKAEPLDVEENTIEMEDNLVNFMQEPELPSQEGEEIIGNYDSPIVNIKREVVKRNTPNIFKKTLEPQPVIMNIHTVTEGNQLGVRLLNIKEENLKIVDISKISTGQNPIEETIIGTTSFDTMDGTQEKTSQIMISNVQSMAELSEENLLKESEIPKGGAMMLRESEAHIHRSKDTLTRSEHEQKDMASGQNSAVLLQPVLETCNVAAEDSLSMNEPDPLESHPVGPRIRDVTEESFNATLTPVVSEARIIETNEMAVSIKVETISEHSQDGEEIVESHVEHGTDLENNIQGSQEQGIVDVGGSLGSLEAKIEMFAIGSQEQESPGAVGGQDGNLGSLDANVGSLGVERQDQESFIIIGSQGSSLGSLEAKIGAFCIGSQSPGSPMGIDRKGDSQGSLEANEGALDTGDRYHESPKAKQGGNLGSLETRAEVFGSGSQSQESPMEIGSQTDSLVTLEANTEALSDKRQDGESLGAVGSQSDGIHSLEAKAEALSDERQDQESSVVIGSQCDSLGSLEANVGELRIGSQEMESESIVQSCEDSCAKLINMDVDKIHADRNETAEGSSSIHANADDPSMAILSDNSQKMQNYVTESVESIAVDAQLETSVRPGTDRISSSVEEHQRPVVESDPLYYNSEKIKRTFEESDIGIEREGIRSKGPSYGTEEIDAETEGAPVSSIGESISEAGEAVVRDSNKEYQPPCSVSEVTFAVSETRPRTVEESDIGIEREGIRSKGPSYGTEEIDAETEGAPVSSVGESISEAGEAVVRDSNKEYQPPCSVSEVTFAVSETGPRTESVPTIESEDIMGTSVECASKELEPVEVLCSTSSVEIQGSSVESVGEDKGQSLRAQHIEGRAAQESGVLLGQNEESVSKTDPENVEIGTENQSTKLNVSEEDLGTQESEVLDYSKNNMEKISSEMVSRCSESQNPETDAIEAGLPVEKSEIPEDHNDEEKTEFTEIISEDNSKKVEDSECPATKLLEGEGIKDVITETPEKEPIGETTENIEAELEECLASTSSIASMKANKEKVKICTERLSIDEEEDFTKDIEFDNFIGRNRPANYLGDDFDDDFEMGGIEKPKNGDRLEESGTGSDREGYSDKTVSEEKHVDNSETKEAASKVSEDEVAKCEGREGESENMGDNLSRTEEICTTELHASANNPDVEKSSSLDPVTEQLRPSLSPNREDTLTRTEADEHLDQINPGVTANFKEHRSSVEDEERLEERLLADLDDDIDMKDESTSDQSDDGAEKTLEMIVNDLNESLGELKK